MDIYKVITVTVTHVSPPHAHVVKEERNVPVSLPTLSNQDRELHKDAVLSAVEGGDWLLQTGS